MADALMDRIKAHRSAPTVYDPPTFEQMADRIEVLENKIAKAVEMLQSIRDIDGELYKVVAELEGKE